MRRWCGGRWVRSTSSTRAPAAPALLSFLFHSELILPYYHPCKFFVDWRRSTRAPHRRIVLRESLYVEDAAQALVLAAEKYAKRDLVNLGSGEEISIPHLLEQIHSLVGYQGAIRWDATKPDGQPRRCLDASRALAEFGWHAKTTLRDGLRETIRWFESNAKLAMCA